VAERLVVPLKLGNAGGGKGCVQCGSGFGMSSRRTLGGCIASAAVVVMPLDAYDKKHTDDQRLTRLI
jgi:hypothetical protein